MVRAVLWRLELDQGITIMLTILLTYADGASETVKVYDRSGLMDLAAFYGADSAEILSYKP